MSKDHEKNKEKKLAYPWRNLHGAVWLIGLAYLFISGNWWPGILFLIAFSMLLEAVIMLVFPQSVEQEKPDAMEKTVPFSAPVDTGAANVHQLSRSILRTGCRTPARDVVRLCADMRCAGRAVTPRTACSVGRTSR